MLEISPTAQDRVRQLISSKQENNLCLRVFIQGGGCSGFQYGFQLDSQHDEDDIMIEENEIRVLIDPLSMQYLEGAEIDFKDDLMGSRFVVHNPNASTTCGCGASFSA